MNRTYTQSDRPLQLDTPSLGADALLLKALRGREAISELFHFEMETLWQETQKPLAFERLLGQKVTAKIAHRGSGTRYFSSTQVTPAPVSQSQISLPSRSIESRR